MERFFISLNDWAAGVRTFRFLADTEFFHSFDNAEIQDAAVQVEARVDKQRAGRASLSLDIQGTVTVPCTRCLDPVQLPVEAHPAFSADETEEEFISADGVMDLSQAVYDYVCLSLPIQRVHRDGECNPGTVRFLSHGERKNEEAAPSSPFAALKGLFDSK